MLIVRITELNMLLDNVMTLYVPSCPVTQTDDADINSIGHRLYLVEAWKITEKLKEVCLVEVR